ncbi:MAG: hypothetical protein KAW93_02690 [Methanogenium sp.]|nr:hypothetical protein [Methanogenium sp.]
MTMVPEETLRLNDIDNVQEITRDPPGRRDCGVHQPDDGAEPVSGEHIEILN